MIELEIDGKKVKTDPGSMIIEAADNNGIYIPRFCYHKKLSIAANCRMCLVEVEKAPKPVPACATPVNEGMIVRTKSKNALQAQRYVMEFLLINHPLDCPICDQGGECELQDLSMGFGTDSSQYTEAKRSVADEDIGPLIETHMTRCILCTRCVRFGQEIAGVRELGMLGRSGVAEISTYVQQSLKSELSGNIIDLCPVGALTSKPFRYQARPWELLQVETISPHDCVGSNLYIHTRREKVMRVVSRDNEAINETWISDRDRFSYLGLHHADRIAKPMIKHQGQWQEVDWTKAFEYVTKGLKEIIREFGVDQVAAVLSPNTTTEEGYLLQKIMRELGSDNIDYRIQQQDFADDRVQQPLCDIKIQDISIQDRILLIGSNVRREQPIIAHRVRSSVENNDAKVLCINSYDLEFIFPIAAKDIVHPMELVGSLAAVAKVLGADSQSDIPSKIKASIAKVEMTPAAKTIAEEFKTGNKKLIILGAWALNHPQAALIRALTRIIAKLVNANVIELSAGANSQGLAAVGARPKAGLNVKAAIEKQLKAYILFNLEPEYDCANPNAVQHALQNANFVVAFSAYESPAILAHADIILPIVPFSETDGTFVNVENTWQTFKAAAPCFAEARPGWKVLRVFANMLELPGYQYITAHDILIELKQQLVDLSSNAGWDADVNTTQASSGLTRIAEWPLYRSDAIVRRSEPLQLSGGNETFAAQLNQRTADKFNIKHHHTIKVTQSGFTVEVPVKITEAIPNDCLYLANGYAETVSLGESFGVIEVKNV